MSRRTPETALYAAVKAHLASLGYAAKGEVGGCDVVATKEGEPPLLVIAEMKASLTLDLILQGVDRAPACDAVWLAVRATRRGRDRDPRAHRLLRMLGFGLMAVTLSTGRVEVLAEPAPYRPRRDLRRREDLAREHARRAGDPTPGGLSRAPIMTAYRQTALALAGALRDGPRRPRDLRDIAPDAGVILYRNVYGWFASAGRGLYRLTGAGEAATAAHARR